MCRVSNDRHSSDVRLLYRSPEGAGGGPADAFFFFATPITANDPDNNDQETMRTVDAWLEEVPPPPLIRPMFANDGVVPLHAVASVSRLRDGVDALLSRLIGQYPSFDRGISSLDLVRVRILRPTRWTTAPEDFLEPDLYPDPMDDPERHLQRLREQERQLQQHRRVQRQWARNEQRRTRNDLNQQERRRRRNFNREPRRRVWNQRR